MQPRILQLRWPYMRGADVLSWQKDCRALATMRPVITITSAPDSTFGPKTDTDTRAVQRFLKVADDGKVGHLTVTAVAAYLGGHGRVGPNTPDTVPNASELVSAFKQARVYKWARREPGDVLWIVLHSSEGLERYDGAEGLMNWAAGPDHPKASWHYAIDADSCTSSVHPECIAGHAKGANTKSIGIEMVGKAEQTEWDWLDDFSFAVMQRTAELVAALCRDWVIPIRYVDAAGLLRGDAGVTTHAQVSKAFRQSDHTDPGIGFPMTTFVEVCRGFHR